MLNVQQMTNSFPKPDIFKHLKSKSKSIKYSIILLVIVLLVVAYSIIIHTIKQAPIANVEISTEGLSSLQHQQLDEAMKSEQLGSYFSADLQTIRDKVTQFSWVEEVSISRDWHKGIVIETIPRQPVARFGSERLIDAKGDVYLPASSKTLTEYPLVSLQGDPKQAEVIMQQMQQVNEWFEPLGWSVEDIVLTPRMTWLIRFDSGLRLLVDGENTAQKLLNVSQVLQHQLADKRDDIQSIDSRYKNGFAISWKEP